MSCQFEEKPVLQRIWVRNTARLTGVNILGILTVALIIAGSLLAPLLAPHDPLAANLTQRLQSPTADYPLGTDALGRCILSRILFGGRHTLAAAAAILAGSLTVGTAIGLLAGFLGGRVDYMVQRTLDGFMAFPGLILALAIAGLIGPSLINAVLAIACVHWVGYTRIVRNLTFSLRERTYVMAARTAGAGSITILRRHILPPVRSSIIVLATLDYGRIILSVAGLSFLGLGAQPPTPEWGAMLNEGKAYLQAAPHIMFWPGLAIMATIFALHAINDGITQSDRKKEK